MPKLRPKEWVLIKPEGEPEHLIHEEDMVWMQSQVGGYVELIHVDFRGRVRHAYVSEEAKIRGGVQVNDRATRLYKRDIIVGNLLIDMGKSANG